MNSETAASVNPNQFEQARAENSQDKEFLSSLMNASRDLIYFKDRESRFLRVNTAMAQRLGLASPNDIVGKTDFDFFKSEHAQKAFDDEQQIIATGTALVDQTERETWTDGEVTWASSTKVPLRNANGDITGILGISRNITERIEAEELLKQSEKKFRSLFADSRDAIILLTEDGCFDGNAAVLQLMGCATLEDLLGKHLSDFSPKTQPDGLDSLNGLRAELQSAFQNGSNFFEWQLCRADGTEFSVEVSINRAEFAGKPALQALLRDITWRKIAEQKVRQLSMAVEQGPSAVVITDTKGTIEYVNSKFTATTGYTSEEAIGQNPRILKSNNLPRAVYEDLWRTITKGHEWRGELLNRKKSGELFWESASISPVTNRSGAITHFVAVKEDITDRKRVEYELHTAKATAEEANRAKSEFLANMSHEIRTPMNGVIGLTSMLLDTALTAEQRDYAKTICSSAEALLVVINDILDFSKIEARKLSLQNVDFDLAALVEDSIQVGAERAHRKNIELVDFVEPNLPPRLRGDSGRLRQIITNLVGNAVKFTSTGEVFVVVSLEKDLQEHVVVRFEVRDTGIGISEQVQARLFQAFSQADTSTTRKYGGTGLGLAISKELVTLMGGEVGVTSKEGHGSTFWFTARFEKNVSDAPPTASVDQNALKGLRVLVVDDNVTNRKILNHHLLSWKMDPVCVASGFEALQILRRSVAPFELAILDMQMPEMDGLMLARAIKADPKTCGMHLVILTSMGQLSEADATRSEIAASLVKPVKQTRLFECLVGVVSGASSRKRTAPTNTGAPASPSSDSQRLRILVAEDNKVNQVVAMGQLKKLGLTAEVVVNGLEVLKVIEHTHFDVILMDCQMPEMDGYDATRYIRAKTSRIQPYIIAVTAHAMTGDREKCLSVGMNDYLSKPVQQDDLREALARALVFQEEQNGTPDTFAPPPVPCDDDPLDCPVDMQRLMEVSLDEPERMDQLVQLYMGQAEDLLKQLEESIETASLPAVANHAHKLLGASSTCGMTVMVAPLAKLEQNSKDGSLTGASDLLSQARQGLQAIRTYLAEHLPPAT